MPTVTDLESYQQFAEAQQAEQRAWSAQQAQAQMDFQERMSSTAHQREVADLQAAGLNPILSAHSGASVPSGAMADSDNSTTGFIGQLLQQVLQTQSAREVAGMYTAATLAAAQMSAAASRYGSDMSYSIAHDFPSSLEAVAARQLSHVGHDLEKQQPVKSALSKVLSTVKDVSSSKSPQEAVSKLAQLSPFHKSPSEVVTSLTQFDDYLKSFGVSRNSFNVKTLTNMQKIFSSPLLSAKEKRLLFIGLFKSLGVRFSLPSGSSGKF